MEKIAKTVYLIVVLMAIVYLPRCNPIDYYAGTVEVTVYICLGPTLKCVATVPRSYIMLDTIDKYLPIDPSNGLHRAFLTTLKIKKRLGTIDVDVFGYSTMAKSEYRFKKTMPLPFTAEKDLFEDSIVVFLDVRG